MRKLLTFVLVLAVIFTLTLPMKSNAAFKDMWAFVYRWDGSLTVDGKYELTRITSGISFVVLQRNSAATMETLYQYNQRSMVTTGMAQPVTGTSYASNTVCNDMVSFKVDPSETNDTYVDLIVVDQAGGFTAVVNDFTENTHTIVIDERPTVEHWGAAWLVTTATSTEVDSGIELARPSIIKEMKIHVCTAFASMTCVNVGLTAAGTNGDADGFIHQEQLATAGWHSIYRPGVDTTNYLVSTGGERACYASTHDDGTNSINGPSLGTFLGNFMIGTGDSGLANPGIGIMNKENLVLHGTTEQTLTYTFASGVNTTVTANSTGWGIVWFRFTAIR